MCGTSHWPVTWSLRDSWYVSPCLNCAHKITDLPPVHIALFPNNRLRDDGLISPDWIRLMVTPIPTILDTQYFFALDPSANSYLLADLLSKDSLYGGTDLLIYESPSDILVYIWVWSIFFFGFQTDFRSIIRPPFSLIQSSYSSNSFSLAQLIFSFAPRFFIR